MEVPADTSSIKSSVIGTAISKTEWADAQSPSHGKPSLNNKELDINFLERNWFQQATPAEEDTRTYLYEPNSFQALLLRALKDISLRPHGDTFFNA